MVTTLTEYLNGIEDQKHREYLNDVLENIKKAYPQMELQVKWNKPMFTAHGTFILGFSCSKDHIGIASEPTVFEHFIPEIEKAGYTHGTRLFRIKFTQVPNYALLYDIINYTLEIKADCKTFWLK